MPTRDRWENTGNAMNAPRGEGSRPRDPLLARPRIQSRPQRARTRALPAPIKTPSEVANFSHPDQSKLSCGKAARPVREIGLKTLQSVLHRSNTPPLRHSTSPLATPPRQDLLPPTLAHPLLSKFETSGHKRGAGSVGRERLPGVWGGTPETLGRAKPTEPFPFSSSRTLLTAHHPSSVTTPLVSLCCWHSREPGEGYGSVSPAFYRRHPLPTIWIPLTSKSLR